MKLLRYELKKLFSSKGILFLVTVVLLVNALLCYLSPSGVDKKRSDEEYVAGYRSDIERVIRLAERNIADLSGGGDSFVIRYQKKVIEKYTAILGSGQIPERISGFDEYVAMSGQISLLLFLVVILGSRIILCEHDSRMKSFLCISKRGNRTYVNKLWLMLFLSFGLSAVFSILNLTVCGIKFGFSGLQAPVVSVQSMEFCPYPMSIIGYILTVYVISSALTFLVALLSAGVGKLSGSYIFTFLSGGTVCTCLYLSGFDLGSLFTRYRALNLFGIAVDSLPFYAILLLLTGVLLGVIFCLVGNRQTLFGERMHRAENLLLEKTDAVRKKVLKRKGPRRIRRHGLYVYELKKIFISSKLILLVMLLLGAKIYFCVENDGQNDPYEREYYRLCTELGGELTEDKSATITIGLAQCEAILSRYEEMKAQVQNGLITSEEYNEYLQKLYAAEVRQSAFLRLDEQRRHIESLRNAGKKAEIIYDSGWKTLFGAGPDLYLYALILLLFAGIYSFEYKSGMDRVLPSVKHGGYVLDRTKFLTAATVTAVLYLIFTATDIVFLTRMYPLENLSAPPLSVIGIPMPMNTPLLLYAALFELKRMLGFVLLSVIVCFASKLLRKLYLIIPTVAALTLLPHMLIKDIPRWADFASLL